MKLPVKLILVGDDMSRGSIVLGKFTPERKIRLEKFAKNGSVVAQLALRLDDLAKDYRKPEFKAEEHEEAAVTLNCLVFKIAKPIKTLEF